MTVEKPKPKQLLRPITTGAGSVMNQSQFLAITCNSLEAPEKSRVHGVISFDSHWLKNWRVKPITKLSNRNYGITFDSHLKTALISELLLVLPHSVIGSKFSRHFFNQSEVKAKPIVACACTFSRALCRLRVITSCLDWFNGLSPSF